MNGIQSFAKKHGYSLYHRLLVEMEVALPFRLTQVIARVTQVTAMRM